MNLNIPAAAFPAATKSTYLNSASVALMYAGCQTAINHWNNDLAENGTVSFDEHAEQTVFDELHDAFAQMVSALPTDIAVASSATEQLATLAWAIMPPKDTKILSSGIVFPTTIYPFSRVARHTGATIEFVEAENDYVDPEKILERIDDQTSVVCLSHVEFGSGQKYDLNAFSKVCKNHDAYLIVDATQSAGAIPINASESGADAIICAGYKWLCGPFGASVMYVSPQLQTTLDPGLIGFRSNRDIWKLDLTYQDYPDTAHRFEFSTMAYGCAKGLAKSVEFLNQIGVENIAQHNLNLGRILHEELVSLGAEVISPTNASETTSIISARIPGVDSKTIVQKLNEANIIISPRRDFFRLSPHLYNTEKDLEIALSEIKKIAKQST